MTAPRKPPPKRSANVRPGAHQEHELALEARALVLLEATLPGASDEKVAEKWGISSKTIQRMRRDVHTDPAFAEALRRAWAKADPYEEIQRSILVLVRKATELASMARSPKDLRGVRDLIACLGEILVSRDALVPKVQDEADRKNPGP